MWTSARRLGGKRISLPLTRRQREHARARQLRVCFVLAFVTLILLSLLWLVFTLFFANSTGNAVDPMPEFLLDHQVAVKRHTTDGYAIPNILVFTYAFHLLNTTRKLTDIEQTLQWNIQNTIRLHPAASVRFLTDEECAKSIEKVMGKDLVKYFWNEPKGCYKADVCRGAALYETGGLYFDADLGVRMSVWTALKNPLAKLVIPQEPAVYESRRRKRQLFQAFVGATKGHDVIWRYLKEWESYYKGTLKDIPVRDYGVAFMKRALDASGETNAKPSELELWTESQHSMTLYPHVPPPTWKVWLQEACTYVVVAQSEEPTRFDRQSPAIVPFYSHIRGSWRCNKE